MAYLNNSSDLTLQDRVAKEEVKNAMFLITRRHILDTEAAEILANYKRYTNNNYISIYAYVYALYTNID